MNCSGPGQFTDEGWYGCKTLAMSCMFILRIDCDAADVLRFVRLKGGNIANDSESIPNVGISIQHDKPIQPLNNNFG